MAVEDGLLKTALIEVRYAVPVHILDVAGGQPFIDKVVTERLKEVRDATLKNIPPSWKHKVVRYIVYRLKQAIFEAWKDDDRNSNIDRWYTLSLREGRIPELLEEYMDAEITAQALMCTILEINNMRCRVSVPGVSK